MQLELACCTHVGLKRSENQDQVLTQALPFGSSSVACLAVADGMGGHEKGREASHLAIATIQSRLEILTSNPDNAPTEAWCMDLEEEAHRAVSGIASAGEVAGTTLTVALVVDDECIIGHVGDSRAYCFRNGSLDQITEDQTWEAYAAKNNMENVHGKALRQAVGVAERIEPEIYRVGLQPQDWLLLCSDGLYKMVDMAKTGDILRASRGAQEACEKLVELALAGGGKDNIGVCIARCGGTPSASPSRMPLLIAVVALVITLVLLALALTHKI